MKPGTKILVSLLAAAAMISSSAWAQGGAKELSGAGATFPAPLYKKWIAEYQKTEPTTRIQYAPIGSGDGVKRFLADALDFGASDSAMSDEQIAAAKNGAVLIPVTAGEIVLAYNLPGLNGDLKLSRELYIAILSGKVSKWNDPRIQAVNPGLYLPDRNIMLVVRQDSSGTTFALTNHLATVSQEWRDRGPGVGKVVAWPDDAMRVRGNEGVATRIKHSLGSIGYIEYGFAKNLGMQVAHLENKTGYFVAPGAAGGQAALANNLGLLPANLRAFIPDPDGADSYPIVTFSWLLLKERYADPAKAAVVKRFVAWGLGEGQHYSSDLGYIPLPADVAGRGKAALTRIQ